MKNAKLFLSLVSLLVVFSLTACFGTPAQPTIDYQALINTSVAQTEVAEGPSGEVVPSSSAPTATSTLLPTNTAIPTFTPIPTLAATPTPCYSIGFVKDVTIPDGTKESAGASFTKTWRLQNLGTCTWTTAFKLVFVSGNQMGAPSSTALPKTVAPGAFVDVSVTMTTPSADGTYQGFFKIKADDGTVFGLGGVNGIAFWVKIIVSGPLFAVTKVNTWTVTPNCGSPSVTFKVLVWTNAGGTVKLHWVFDNNGTKITGPSQSSLFGVASNQYFTTTWDLTGLGFTGPGSASVYIDSPNHQLFGPSPTFTCP